MLKGKINRYRWVVSSLIFFITLVNFIDRSAISFVISPLKAEFHFNDTQFGLILSAFGIGYVFLTSIGGWLVDLWGTRIVWTVAAIAWSLSIALFSYAAGFWMFVGLRVLLGITEGPHFPAMTRTISDWLPPMERARALSLGLIAIPLSAVLGAPLISYLVTDFGWRAMFLVMSSLGILWAIAWYLLFRDSPLACPFVGDKERKLFETKASTSSSSRETVNWKLILTHPALIANNIAYFSFGYMLFVATLWLPGYFLSEHGLDLKSVGWYLTIPWIVGAIFLQLGGNLSDWIYRKTGSCRLARSHLIWVSQFLAAICFVILGFTQNLYSSLIFLSLGLGFGLMPQPAFFSTNIDVVKERAGASQGITSSCLSLAGIIAPTVTGWLIDFTGSYRSTFILLGALTLIGVVVVILFHHPDRKYTKEASAIVST